MDEGSEGVQQKEAKFPVRWFKGIRMGFKGLEPRRRRLSGIFLQRHGVFGIALQMGIRNNCSPLHEQALPLVYCYHITSKPEWKHLNVINFDESIASCFGLEIIKNCSLANYKDWPLRSQSRESRFLAPWKWLWSSGFDGEGLKKEFTSSFFPRI